ncbi:MAG: LPS-assembly protein LptD [Hyphomicrobium sp.]
MRRTRTPQEGCGTSREKSVRRLMNRAARAFGCAFALAATFACAVPAQAQDPSLQRTGGTAASSFPTAPGGMFGNVKKKIDGTKPMNLQGDQLVYDTAGNKVIARGNVEIFYNDYILTADEVVYDQSAGTLTAAGNVTLKEPQGNVIRADRYTLTDDFRDGFVQSLSVVTKDDTRISAERATRRDGNVTEFQNGKFTPCKSEGNTPPLWCISAARIIHDKDAAVISYQDAYFEIFGQPVLYLPYFQHADPSVKRKSGFLAPQYGQSTNLGFITGIPYYFALDPSFDFTFNPLYLSEQGVLWQGEWRQRLANGQYSVNISAIDQDSDDLPGTLADRDDLNGWRGSLQTRGLFSLSSWWKFGWDVTLESDDQFRRFYRLDNILLTDRVNQVFLTGQSDRNYFSARLYHFGGLMLDDTNQAESYTHPIIDYNYVFADPVLGGELKWDTNFLSFTRVDGALEKLGGAARASDQNINRLTTELKWRRRFTDTIGITYTPFGNLRGDAYQFDDFTDPESVVLNANGTVNSSSLVSSDTTFRGIAAGGVTVAYPWINHTASASHIVEPIGQIVARQASVTQRRLPDEDARSLVFDDTNLFEVNKFSGLDRTEMGTRANVGVQYTFQANDGGYARFLAGQSFHLSGDNVYANPGLDSDGNPIYSAGSGLQTNKSDYVLGAYVAPTDAFRLIAQSRFDENDMRLMREDAGVQVFYGPVFGQVSYAYTAADPLVGINAEQQDILATGMLRLTDNWSIGAGFRYDIDASELRQDSVQVKYADECFVLTATYQELYYNSATIDDDRSLMLRFELKHLGEFKYKTDALDFAFGGEQRTN